MIILQWSTPRIIWIEIVIDQIEALVHRVVFHRASLQSIGRGSSLFVVIVSAVTDRGEHLIVLTAPTRNRHVIRYRGHDIVRRQRLSVIDDDQSDIVIQRGAVVLRVDMNGAKVRNQNLLPAVTGFVIFVETMP